MIIVEKDLGGVLKWIACNNVVLIDPKYREEYETSVRLDMDKLEIMRYNIVN